MPVTSRPALTKAQSQIMDWLGKGWTAYVLSGGRVEINGQVVGRLATLKALEARGLIRAETSVSWVAVQRDKDRPAV